jgi:hypothetical protein
MAHIVLLGDSIFDNAAYVGGGPDVVRQLRGKLPEGWQASLNAIDGAVTRGVAEQLRGLPADVSHLVVSVGGNDALGASHVLGQRVASVGEAVMRLAGAQEEFAGRYETMLEAVIEAGLPTAVCTIYDTPQTSAEARMIRAALALFNDAITRAAFRRGVDLIDLRLICDDPADYANPIEPSVAGGDKISSAILAWASGDRGVGRSTIVPR